MEQAQDTTMHVRISRATEVVWEGEARSLSSKNTQGPFDVLPLHENFITLIKKEPIIVHEATGKTETYQFDQSVVYVTNNQVKIYADFTT
jgi:F0F1-type ATP synthase epsilon subunit